MTEKELEEKKRPPKKQKKRDAEDLPYCTNAPSAEHARANGADEPCDDGRGQE